MRQPLSRFTYGILIFMTRNRKYDPFCTFEGCEKPHHSLGLCSTHWAQRRRGVELQPIGYHKPSLVRDDQNRKKCFRCEDWKSEEEYYSHPKAADKLNGVCKECVRSESVESRYSLPPGWITAQKSHLDGVCPICSLSKERWAVDHDHSCCPGNSSCGLCVRGLICRDCNILLGMANDTPEILEGAVRYLRERT